MIAPIAGKRALRKIQFGKESTPGVAVPATARIVGTLGMKQENQYYRPADLETARLSEFERSVVTGKQATLPFEADANFEQLPYLLGMAVKGSVTASGSGGQHVRDYTPNLTSSANLDTYTVEYGDDVAAYRSTYCVATDLEISGQIDEVLMVKATLIGQSVEPSPFTPGLNPPPALNSAIMDMGKLYLDSSYANLGSTRQEATLVDFSYKVSQGITPMKYGDGSLSFSQIAEKKRHIDLDLTVAYNANAVSLYPVYNAQTSIFIRLDFDGPAGAKLTLDGCYVIDDYGTLEERDGQDIVKLTLVSIYDQTGNFEWGVKLVNSLPALP